MSARREAQDSSEQSRTAIFEASPWPESRFCLRDIEVFSRAQGGPKSPPKRIQTQMEPPNTSLRAPWAPPIGPQGSQKCPREHPKQDQERPKPLICHWFLMGFANRCFSEAAVTKKKGPGLTRRCEDVFPRSRKIRVSPTSLFLSN